MGLWPVQTTACPLGVHFMSRRSTLFRSAVLSLVIAFADLSSAWSDTLYVADQSAGAIQTYDAATGALLNPSFITGLIIPWGLTISGSTLYVSDYGAGTVRAYDVATGAVVSGFSLSQTGAFDTFVSGTTLYSSSLFQNTVGTYNPDTGAAMNQNFVSGAQGPQGILINEGILLVCETSVNAVATYDAATGALINSSFITGAISPAFLAIKGDTLYVSEIGSPVATYDVTTGELIDPSFVSLPNAVGLAVDGNTLYVSSLDGLVEAYDATTGDALTGFTTINVGSGAAGLAVLSGVPEPHTMGLLGLAVLVIGYGVSRRRQGQPVPF